MRKNLVGVIIMVFVLTFALGTLVPASHAVVPKKIICWYECFEPHMIECCKYIVPGAPNFIICEDTGYLCAY